MNHFNNVNIQTNPVGRQPRFVSKRRLHCFIREQFFRGNVLSTGAVNIKRVQRRYHLPEEITKESVKRCIRNVIHYQNDFRDDGMLSIVTDDEHAHENRLPSHDDSDHEVYVTLPRVIEFDNRRRLLAGVMPAAPPALPVPVQPQQRMEVEGDDDEGAAAAPVQQQRAITAESIINDFGQINDIEAKFDIFRACYGCFVAIDTINQFLTTFADIPSNTIVTIARGTFFNI